MTLPSLTIFFPFFNDEGTVLQMIDQGYKQGRKIAEDLEVIAIHGGPSSDGTWEAIEAAKREFPDLVVLNHEENQEGYGVIRHGFSAASKEWVFYTDGDGQYSLEDLPKLVEKALTDRSHVVNGYKKKRSDSWSRIFLGAGYQLFCRLFFDLPIRDVDCDFRLIEKRFLSKITFSAKKSSILLELILKLKGLGAKFSEVPVAHLPRVYGRSNYSGFSLLKEKIVGDLSLYWKGDNLFHLMNEMEGTLWWYVALRELVIEKVRSYSNQTAKIVDLGCGTGACLKTLMNLGYSVTGVDLSSDAIDYSKKRGVENVLFGSVVKLPIESSSQDIALAIDIFCMLRKEEQRLAVLEIYRILKPGGFLIFNEPAYLFLWSQHDICCEVKDRFTKNKITSLFQREVF